MDIWEVLETNPHQITYFFMSVRGSEAQLWQTLQTPETIEASASNACGGSALMSGWSNPDKERKINSEFAMSVRGHNLTLQCHIKPRPRRR